MFSHEVKGSWQEESHVAGANGRDELEDGADVFDYDGASYFGEVEESGGTEIDVVWHLFVRKSFAL